MTFVLPHAKKKGLSKKQLQRIKNEQSRESCRRGREKLLEQLGGQCACCGIKEKLGFDHIRHEDKEHSAEEMRRMAAWTKLAYYKRKAIEGKIQVLCETCNRFKADGDACPGTCKEEAA